jgi:hypothetical protein
VSPLHLHNFLSSRFPKLIFIDAFFYCSKIFENDLRDLNDKEERDSPMRASEGRRRGGFPELCELNLNFYGSLNVAIFGIKVSYVE